MNKQEIIQFVKNNYFYDYIFYLENSHEIETTLFNNFNKGFSYEEWRLKYNCFEKEKEEDVIGFLSIIKTATVEKLSNKYSSNENIFNVYKFSSSGLKKVVDVLWENLVIEDVITIMEKQKVSIRLFEKIYSKFKDHAVLESFVQQQRLTVNFIDKYKKDITLSDLCDNPWVENLTSPFQYQDFLRIREIITTKISEVGLENADTRVLKLNVVCQYYNTYDIIQSLIKKIIKLENGY